MYLSMMMVVATAMTPAQSKAADELAITYFSQACADGNERYAVVTPDDGILHELTRNAQAETVTIDEDGFKRLCSRSPLIAYHCHPKTGVLGPFPGLGADARSSDFGTVAYLEVLCSSEPVPPVIEHRIIHTGGTNEVVAFGLRGVPLEQARSLGRRMTKLAEPPEPYVSAYGIPDWGDISTRPKRMMEARGNLEGLYGALYESYQSEMRSFLQATCPKVTSEAELGLCQAFSLEAFVAQRDACADRYVRYRTAGTCVPALTERIDIGGPRHPGWTELTGTNYDEFTGTGTSVVTFCSDTRGFDGARPCAVVFEELGHELPECRGLKRGYVDVARHGELIARHEAVFEQTILVQDGRKFTINVPRLSDQMFAAILCGPEVLFPANPFN